MTIPIPIVVPQSSSGTSCEYVYPEWVEHYVGISLSILLSATIVLIVSIIVMLISILIDNDNIHDHIAKPIFIISGIIALFGLILILIGIVIMAATGTKI